MRRYEACPGACDVVLGDKGASEGSMTIDASSRGFDWKNSSTEQKLEFLYHWCETLENMTNNNRTEVVLRLNKLEQERKAAG
jgi:hypothetical protein